MHGARGTGPPGPPVSPALRTDRARLGSQTNKAFGRPQITLVTDQETFGGDIAVIFQF